MSVRKRNEFMSKSPGDTFNLAARLAEKALPGDVFALSGDLGAGKTVFARGFASGLGIDEDITSPTFNLLEEYSGKLNFYHFDLYRIETIREFDNLDFEDYWEGNGVSVVEWAERAAAILPDSRINIYIEYIDEESRRITIEYPDNRHLD